MNFITHNKKILFSILIFIILFSGFISAVKINSKLDPIHSDGFTYYSYLPSFFIYKGLTMENVVKERTDTSSIPEDYIGIYKYENGNYIPKITMGVAVLMFPFFILAHLFESLTNSNITGFEASYQFMVGISGLVFAGLGLIILRKILSRYFSFKITVVTIISILLGTNLLHYSTFDSTFSHSYSFFAFNSFLLLTILWHEEQTTKRSILVGIFAGLIVLIRPTNIIFLIIFPLFNVYSFKSLNAKIIFLKQYKFKILQIIFASTLVFLPQIIYWYLTTGKPLLNSYGEGENFNFLNPQIFNVLFSIRKGFFFWTPLALICLAGIIPLYKKYKEFAAGFLVYLILHIFIISSWWSWWFGASFGHRTFVDCLAVFAFLLAALLSQIKAKMQFIVLGILVLVTTLLSLIYMRGYWNGGISQENMSWEMYQEFILSIF